MIDFPGLDLSRPFALLAKAGVVSCHSGALHHLQALNDIHLLARSTGRDVVFVLPYRVVRERGFAARGDEPILALAVETVTTMKVAEFAALLPDAPVSLAGEIVPSMEDDAYAAMVRRFQQTEIEGGNASQATLARRFSGRLEGFGIDTVLSLYRRLLRDDGQYMTVLFAGEQGDERSFLLGATPERHLEISGNETIMNPIAGTLRKEDRETFPDRLARFVEDPKEVNELFQVVDEEMKMMSLICPEGGRIEGPFLREIGAVVHTEYQLVGKRGPDTIEALRRTLHAPTVMGSPMESAARIIAAYEPESRRYYAGEIGIYRCPRTDQPNGDLDSAILIRCAEIFADGRFDVRAGGGLVRDSDPMNEAHESRAKAMGFLRLLTGQAGAGPYLTPELAAAAEPVLAGRNARLSPFWMNVQRHGMAPPPELTGLSLLVLNNEDDFAHMLAHMLGGLGATCQVVDSLAYDAGRDAADILVLGPGPGDPTDMSHPRMARLQEIILAARDGGTPMLGICLGHQALAVAEGLTVTRQDQSTQGLQIETRVFGAPHRLGFYNSFSPVLDDKARDRRDIRLDLDPSNRVTAMHGASFIGFQFHPESIMSETGDLLLWKALMHLRHSLPVRTAERNY